MQNSNALFILAALLCASCAQPSPVPPSETEHASVQTLADSLIYATKEFCLPYVVNGDSVQVLSQRPGVTEHHVNVHGTDVTSYQFERPGSPEVTPSATSGSQDYCRVALNVSDSSNRPSIVTTFTRDLRLDEETTELRDGVLCVRGPYDAVITIANPAPPYPITVYIKSDAVTLAAVGCDAQLRRQ